jgi:hypothetical protein
MKKRHDFCEVCFGLHQRDRQVQTYDVDMLIAGQVVRMHRPLDLCDLCAQRMSELGIISAVTRVVMSPSRGATLPKTTSGAPNPDGSSVQGRLIPRRGREGIFRGILARLGGVRSSAPEHRLQA